MTTGDLAALALKELRAPHWRRMALLWFALGFVCDLALALSHPPGLVGLVAIIVLGILAGLLFVWIAAAALRRATGSSRSPWRIDGSLLLYTAVHFAIVTAALAPAWLMNLSDFGANLVNIVLPLLLLAPLAPWLVAVAVERPLAVSPGRFLSQANGWLPPLLLLTLVLILPLSLAQYWAWIALFDLGRGAVEFALMHATLSTLTAIVSLALALAAYRSVAEA